MQLKKLYNTYCSNNATYLKHTTLMLQQFQIDMLKAAAQHPGRIAQICAAAIFHNDDDTIIYIAQHYANDEHFNEAQVAELKAFLKFVNALDAVNTGETVH